MEAVYRVNLRVESRIFGVGAGRSVAAILTVALGLGTDLTEMRDQNLNQEHRR